MDAATKSLGVWASNADYHLLRNFIVIGSVLMAIGIIGFVTRRDLVFMVLSVAIMFQGIVLVATGFSAFHQTWAGQLVALFASVVVVVQVVLVLAVVFAASRSKRALTEPPK